MRKKPILLLGFFLKDKNQKRGIRTVEDRMAEMFAKGNIGIITSSSSTNRLLRLCETVYTVITKRKDYTTAMVPLFGTTLSFLWQEVITRLLKMLNKKIILTIHGGSIPEQIDSGETKFLTAMKRADELVVPSKYFQKYFEQKGFRVTLIENPVDLSEYTFHSKEFIRPRIIWMRAFTEVYNPEMAIRVAKRLGAKYKDFKMIMAGKDGPLKNAIKEMVNENNLSEKIIFPGYITTKEKNQFAEDFDIYICTNKIDNAPVSLIEFMAIGLPVVSVNVGGIPYMITHEENGLLVNGNDDEAMFIQINRLIEDTAFAKSICINARDYALHFDQKNVLDKWKKLLDPDKKIPVAEILIQQNNS
jgi:glycosyltransferase involved in cell wall biosynthesis